MELATSLKHGTQPNLVDTTGLCLLSLDGGGVRGLSTLYILKIIMDRLNHERKAASLPPVKPCEVFDMIGGTSTGGQRKRLIAVMLGFLEMDVDQCITAYTELAEAVFGERVRTIPVGLTGKVNAQFSSEVLGSAIWKVVGECGASPTDLFNDGKQRGCRTFVCAVDRDTKDTVRLRSYTLPDEPNVPATICQAALATSAATTFFDPITIGNRSFADGGLGANNPVEEVAEEASNVWCNQTRDLKPLVKCFISIGTGNPGLKPFENGMLKFLAKTVVEIATQTEKTEKLSIARWADHHDAKRYFRFNVQQGLQSIGLDEYKKQGAIEAATSSYLTNTEQKTRVRDCIQNLKLKENKSDVSFAAEMEHYNSRVRRQSGTKPSEETYYKVPAAPSLSFSGREGILQQIHEAFDQVPGRTSSRPRIVVLYGVGGQGKSQIALECCSRSRQRYRGVFWIDASSEDTTRSGFDAIARKIDPSSAAVLNDTEEKARLVLDALTTWKQAWLLVFDSFDQPDTFSIQSFLPKLGRGSILITSRHRDSHSYAQQKNVIRVPSMERDGALVLLRHRLGSSTTDEKGDCERSELVQRLRGLALAIDQAAAYISFHRLSIREFLQQYDRKREWILEQHREGNWHFKGSMSESEKEIALAAYTTWEMSIQRIARYDQQRKRWILHFLSVSAFLRPQRIGEYMFREYRSVQDKLPAWTSTSEGNLRLADRRKTAVGKVEDRGKQTRWVSLFEGPRKNSMESKAPRGKSVARGNRPTWKKEEFWRVIQELGQLSLIQNTGKYRPNTLGVWYSIHPVIQDWLQIRLEIMARRNSLRGSINLVGAVINTGFAASAPREIKRELLGHIDLLVESFQHLEPIDMLGRTAVGRTAVSFGRFYRESGHATKAIKTLTYIVLVREAHLARNHPDCLEVQYELALAYHANAQIPEAVKLLVHVVVDHQAFIKNHRLRLTSQRELASAYRANGQVPEAVELLERVVAASEALADGQSNRVVLQRELASAYRANGEDHKALVLLEPLATVSQPHPSDNRDLARLTTHQELVSAHSVSSEIPEPVSPEAVRLPKNIAKVGRTSIDEIEGPVNMPERAVQARLVGVEKIAEAAHVPERASNVKSASVEEITDVDLSARTVTAEQDSVQAVHPPERASNFKQASVEEIEDVDLPERTVEAEQDSVQELIEAVNLPERALKAGPGGCEEDWPTGTTAQLSFAQACHANGQSRQAIEVLEHIVMIEHASLAEYDPARLPAQEELASAYWARGQHWAALQWRENIVRIGQVSLLEADRTLFKSQGALAEAYRAQGMVQEAVELLKDAIKAQHANGPDYLASQRKLTNTYHTDGRRETANMLLAHADKIWQTSLSRNHPDDLESEYFQTSDWFLEDPYGSVPPSLPGAGFPPPVLPPHATTLDGEGIGAGAVEPQSVTPFGRGSVFRRRDPYQAMKSLIRTFIPSYNREA